MKQGKRLLFETVISGCYETQKSSDVLMPYV